MYYKQKRVRLVPKNNSAGTVHVVDYVSLSII